MIGGRATARAVYVGSRNSSQPKHPKAELIDGINDTNCCYARR
jgi:hypothetical protein